MDFKRTVSINAPLEDVWALTEDLEAVAGCIPGVSGFSMRSPQAFDCRLSQHVGSVKSNFDLSSEMRDVVPLEGMTLVSEGRDKALNSTVRTTQTFRLRPDGDATTIDIDASIQVTGRIATFGHRIILAKAEKVTVDALSNVAALLEQRRPGSRG